MKQRNQLIFIAMLLSLPMTLLSGCNDERTIRVATEAADRQAEQNREMARVSREATEATNRLIVEEGAARREIVQLHQEIQKERGALSENWSDLESERQNIADERRDVASERREAVASLRTDSFLADALPSLAITGVAAISLALAWLVLFRVTTEPEDDRAVMELLLNEFATSDSSPLRLPPLADRALISNSKPDGGPDTGSQRPLPSLSVDPPPTNTPTNTPPNPPTSRRRS